MLGLRSLMLNYSASMAIDFSHFLDSVYYPALLSILLAALIWRRRYHWAVAVIPLFCLAAMLYSPLLQHINILRHPAVQRYDHMMKPFEFGGRMAVDGADQLLVSAGMDRELELLSDNPSDISGMYNFFSTAGSARTTSSVTRWAPRKIPDRAGD